MSTSGNIKVLVVDDSPVVRQAIRRALELSPAIGEVSTASTGSIALKKVRKHRPDVITMDLEMPGMDGIDTLSAIHEEYPAPVIMLSAFTFEGAEKTIAALEMGAVDFIQKPGGRLSSDIVTVAEELISKICAVAPRTPIQFKKQVKPTRTRTRIAKRPSVAPIAPLGALVAIGASTGGTEAIRSVLVKIPADFPAAIVVVQHMPPGFTRAFATRLNELCHLEVKEATPRDVLVPGRVLIAPGHSHMRVVKGDYGYFVELNKSGKVNGHMPSVDVMFDSVAQRCEDLDVVSILLTGMGRDGANGLNRIRCAGGHTIAQDEESSVVYGMPRAAVELGAASRVLPLHQMAYELARRTPAKKDVQNTGKPEPGATDKDGAHAERSNHENSVVG